MAITHRERNYAIKALSYQQTIRSFSQSAQQPTLCADSYWRAGLAWLQHEWRWTHRQNDKQNCASAPSCSDFIDPFGNNKVVCFQLFPSGLPAWSSRDDEVTVHIGKRDRGHSFISSTKSFFEFPIGSCECQKTCYQ